MKRCESSAAAGKSVQTEKLKYFISNSFLGIKRNAHSYIVLGVIIFVVFAALSCAYRLSVENHEFYLRESRDTGAVQLMTPQQLDYYNNIVLRADAVAGYANVIILAFSVLGAASLLFACSALYSRRMGEFGTLYSIGLPKGYITASLELESSAFIIGCELCGMLAGALLYTALKRFGAVPDISVPFDIGIVFAAAILSAAVLAIATALLILKTKKLTPKEMMRSASGGEG